MPKKELSLKEETGKVIKNIAKITEFKKKDLFQIIIGATILAIPVGLTEETWKLGESLPLINVLLLLCLTLVFISAFNYYTYYHKKLKKHWKNFSVRVLSTYILTFILVAILLGLIQKTPWQTNWILSIKRIIIVSFPSSMSATVADTIK